MTANEFQEKYHIKNRRYREVLDVLDFLYLEYTREQILDMVNDYLENADNIFNTTEDAADFTEEINDIKEKLLDKKKDL